MSLRTSFNCLFSSVCFKGSQRLIFTTSFRTLAKYPCRQSSTMVNSSASIRRAEDFLSFVDASPSPFHAVHAVRQRLERAGFKLLREKEPWSSVVKPGGKYYFTRNGSTIAAFAVGQKWRPGGPIAMIGAHTDSPCLRVKPVSKKQSDGYLQVGVETYGGGLWHTWFDRDLSIAGRALVKSSDGSIIQKLVKIDRPILRIPTLAIHLDRQETFSYNKETQLFPIAGLAAAELNRKGGNSSTKADDESSTKSPAYPLKAMSERHHPYIVELIAKEAEVDPDNVVDFEMVLYDTQKPCFGGLNNELIFSARLDNLEMTYCTVESLIASVTNEEALSNESTIRLMTCFDHEEIGSNSAQGADSNLLPGLIRRLSVVSGSNGSKSSTSEDGFEHLSLEDFSTAYEQSLASSFLVSADMAHSVHPNYPAKHESDHRPEMNKGTVVKINANVRYATNSPGIVLLQEAAKLSRPSTYLISEQEANDMNPGVPLQLFVVRNDSSCGSTIGPMLAGLLGARTIDVGNAQLSMHSIRETGGAHDIEHAIHLFESFYENYGDLEKRIIID